MGIEKIKLKKWKKMVDKLGTEWYYSQRRWKQHRHNKYNSKAIKKNCRGIQNNLKFAWKNELKKVEKVLDKRKRLWYIRWAVDETAKKNHKEPW